MFVGESLGEVATCWLAEVCGPGADASSCEVATTPSEETSPVAGTGTPKG